MDNTIIGSFITAFATIIASIINISKKKKVAICFSILIFVFILILLFLMPKDVDPEQKNISIIFSNNGSISIGGSGDNSESSSIIIDNYTDMQVDQTQYKAVTETAQSSTVGYSNPPSDELLDEYGPGLHYPAKSEYLSECKTMYVAAPKGYSIYAYSSHRSDKIKLYEVLDDEEVTVLAVNHNNGFSCVIIESTQKAAWVNSAYLVASLD